MQEDRFFVKIRRQEIESKRDDKPRTSEDKPPILGTVEHVGFGKSSVFRTRGELLELLGFVVRERGEKEADRTYGRLGLSKL